MLTPVLLIVFQIEKLMIIGASEVLLECEVLHDIPHTTIRDDIVPVDRYSEFTPESMGNLLHRYGFFYHESRPDLSNSEEYPLESDYSRVSIYHLTDVVLRP